MLTLYPPFDTLDSSILHVGDSYSEGFDREMWCHQRKSRPPTSPSMIPIANPAVVLLAPRRPRYPGGQAGEYPTSASYGSK